MNLKTPKIGKTDKETIENLVDTMLMYRKELNFLLKNLSFQNMPLVNEFANEVKEEVELIDGSIVTLSTKILQNSEKISLSATKEETNDALDDVWGTVTQHASSLDVLVDSISSMVRKDELSAEFMINAQSIVQAINTTDGVGKIKTIKVTVDENGLTVYDGAIIIRDSHNTAIITSDGLKIMFVYTSSGDLNGWQRIGYWNEGGYNAQKEAYITFMVPEKLNITNVELVTHSLPSRWTGHNVAEGVPDGIYHPRNMRLFKVSDNNNSVLDWPFSSSYGVVMGTNGRQDITNAIWGGQWSPSGTSISQKIGNVTNHVTSGEYQTFGVASVDSLGSSNKRYMGGLQFTVVVEGYLRG